METLTWPYTQDALQAEIDEQRKTIRTDNYPMSIGEWASLYENKEINIHPEFQRFFRWTPFQKSRLVESILLGIPIPPIFVSQDASGVWDVVDGLQRLSTIYEFMGILHDDQGNTKEPLCLEGTKLLKGLHGKYWQHENPEKSLTQTQRLLIRRAKLDTSILLRESTSDTKYELFSRLNTGGTQLSDQEVRNSILVQLNPPLFRAIESLAINEQFREVVALTDRALDQRYDMDLVTRFIVFRRMDASELRQLSDVNDFITEQITEVAKNKDFSIEREEDAFLRTMSLLHQTTRDASFKKYYIERKRFVGGFSVAAFESVALGIAYHYPDLLQTDEAGIQQRCIQLWSNPEFLQYSESGARASGRVQRTVTIGRQIFAPQS